MLHRVTETVVLHRVTVIQLSVVTWGAELHRVTKIVVLHHVTEIVVLHRVTMTQLSVVTWGGRLQRMRVVGWGIRACCMKGVGQKVGRSLAFSAMSTNDT